ncbi:MAG: hypothetical protein QHH15_06090, partial [Candidatus Thermoplasmatota archaeon]|nr:hypothetical protein [Candidatus Thermoplasmatota archaeon]
MVSKESDKIDPICGMKGTIPAYGHYFCSEYCIKKYEEQQMNVRNNREYDSLSKEIEFQGLEIQLAKKRINEYTAELTRLKEEIEKAQKLVGEKRNELEIKRNELDDIIRETEKEEKELIQKAEESKKL